MHEEEHSKAYVNLQVQLSVQSGQDDDDDGAQIDKGDDGDHEELSDGLLEAGHTTLTTDAGANRGNGNGKRDDQDLGNEIDDADDTRT